MRFAVLANGGVEKAGDLMQSAQDGINNLASGVSDVVESIAEVAAPFVPPPPPPPKLPSPQKAADAYRNAAAALEKAKTGLGAKWNAFDDSMQERFDKNLGNKDFWSCTGGVMKDNGLSLGVTWVVAGVTAVPTGGASLAWAGASTAVIGGAAMSSCWGDHKQTSNECIATAAAGTVVGAGGLVHGAARLAARGGSPIAYMADVAGTGGSQGVSWYHALTGC